MATPSKDFSHFGNPFHWFQASDDDSCWWFVQIEPGLVLRIGPDGEIDTLDEGPGYTMWIVDNDDPKWHSLADCPQRGDSR